MPIRSKIHIDTLLSNLSVKYRNNEHIHSMIAPVVPVKKSSDIFRVYDRDFRIPETIRANRGLAREHDFDVSTSSYNLEKHALKAYISDDDVDNYDISDLRADVTEDLTDKISMRKEKSCATLMTTTNWSQGVSLAAAALWTADTTVSNPIPLFDTGMSVVIANTGYKVNYGVVPRDSFVAAKNHSSVIDRVKYTSRELDENIVAALFGLEKMLVPQSTEDTAAEGATSVISSIWRNDFVFLGYSPGTPGPRKVSSMYMFRKNKPLVKRWRDDERESEAVEVNDQYQFKVVASLTGYYINNSI